MESSSCHKPVSKESDFTYNPQNCRTFTSLAACSWNRFQQTARTRPAEEYLSTVTEPILKLIFCRNKIPAGPTTIPTCRTSNINAIVFDFVFSETLRPNVPRNAPSKLKPMPEINRATAIQCLSRTQQYKTFPPIENNIPISAGIRDFCKISVVFPKIGAAIRLAAANDEITTPI